MPFTSLTSTLALTVGLLSADYTFTNIADTAAGSPFRGFKLGVAINDEGTVAFVAVTRFVGDSPTDQTVYTKSSGELKKIVDSSGSLKDFAIGGVNRMGVVALLASDSSYSHGIYAGDGGPLSTIALNSDTTRLGPLSRPPDIGPDGAVAFIANDRVLVQRGADRRIVFDNRTGPRAGAAPSAVQWNSRGDLSFLLTHLDLTRGGVFYDRNGVMTTVADDSGTVSFAFPYLISINDEGTIAFRAWTKTQPVNQGVFTANGGGRVVPVQANPLAGNIIAGESIGINNDGVVAYSLPLVGGQVPAIVTGPDSPKDNVIRVGDDLFGSKVVGLGTANPIAGRFLNNRGQIVFIYRLQSGVLGIAVATPVPPVASAGRPVLPAGAVVNAASLSPQSPSAPGSVVSLFGSNFASKLTVADTPTLPTSLDGVSVLFNGIAAPLFFVSPGQINAQVPFELTGANVEIRVRNRNGDSEVRSLPLTGLDPAVYTMDQSGTRQAVAVLANTATIAAPVGAYANSRPARRGETITIYVNGLGAVAPSIANGANSCGGICAADGSNLVLRHVITPPTILLNGLPVPAANVLYVGLAPQFAGLYQINVTLPADAPLGIVELRLRQSNTAISRQGVTFAIQ